MKATPRSLQVGSILSLLVVVILVASCGQAVYMKMNPPPDVDKAFFANNNSCYQATAANMLAAAGYGRGNTVQARVDDIYADLTAQFGTVPRGWTDAALQWWLNANHNTWTNNPYTVVTVDGNKSPRYPWAEPNGAWIIASELRNCVPVGLSISWPTNAVDAGGNPVIGAGGHAMTSWGDEGGLLIPLGANPETVRGTDSDSDTGGDVQVYDYDDYTSPNPGGANEGNGWYINYSPNHPYIKHIVTLSPTDDPSDNKLTQKVLGSYKIHQASNTGATDLHYVVGTDVNILSYRTMVSWPTEEAPAITESQPQRRDLTVDWDFTDKPVPQCEWVRITTEFVLPAWNAMEYDDVHFTYPDALMALAYPSLYWLVETPFIDKAEAIPNVTGGYVVGSFDVVDPQAESREQLVAQYRLLHQYSYSQSPEFHTFVLRGTEGYHATNFRFGHSYGYLNPEALWRFEEWMTETPKAYPLGEEAIELAIDWAGLLPYPEGEDISGMIPDLKQGLTTRLP